MMDCTMNDSDMGGIGKLSRKRLSKVVKNHKGCITSVEVAQSLEIPTTKARSLLANWYKHGWLQKIHPGVYLAVELAAESPEDILIDPWVIASQLFAPSYIGGWSACQYWNFTEQLFDKTLVITGKRINGKEQKAGNTQFLLKKIDSTKFFGLKTIWKESIRVQVSDPHKTIVDMLDDPALVGGIRFLIDMLQKYLQSEHFNPIKLIEYAEKMKNKTIFKRLGYLLSILKPAEVVLIEECKNRISQGNTQIDPSSKGHRLLKRWGLWLPENFKDNLKLDK